MLGLFGPIETVSIVLFCIGMGLILIEMFIPGIGIFGGLGFVALVLCIVFQANNGGRGAIAAAHHRGHCSYTCARHGTKF